MSTTNSFGVPAAGSLQALEMQASMERARLQEVAFDAARENREEAAKAVFLADDGLVQRICDKLVAGVVRLMEVKGPMNPDEAWERFVHADFSLRAAFDRHTEEKSILDELSGEDPPIFAAPPSNTAITPIASVATNPVPPTSGNPGLAAVSAPVVAAPKSKKRKAKKEEEELQGVSKPVLRQSKRLRTKKVQFADDLVSGPSTASVSASTVPKIIPVSTPAPSTPLTTASTTSTVSTAAAVPTTTRVTRNRYTTEHETWLTAHLQGLKTAAGNPQSFKPDFEAITTAFNANFEERRTKNSIYSEIHRVAGCCALLGATARGRGGGGKCYPKTETE